MEKTKKFAKDLENRLENLQWELFDCQQLYQIHLREESLEIRLQKLGLRLVQITEKPTDPEAARTLEIKLKYVKVKPVKPNIGWKWLSNVIG